MKKEETEYYYPKCPICEQRMILITWKRVIGKWFCDYCQKSWVRGDDKFSNENLVEEKI